MQAYRARHELIGANEPDIISCMGVPGEKQLLSMDQSVLQWDYAQSGADLDLALGLYELKLGRPGVCHAVIRFDGATVRSVHFTGTAINAADPDSICGNLVADCLHHRDTLPMPSFFDPAVIAAGK